MLVGFGTIDFKVLGKASRTRSFNSRASGFVVLGAFRVQGLGSRF